MTPARMAEIHAAAFAGRGQVWPEAEIAALMSRPVIAAVTEGAAGFALVQILPPEAEILTLAVDPALQGRGHGTRLVRAILDRAAAAGAEQVFLEVAADNAPALALYARAGFGRIGLRRGYYARPGAAPVDALTLACRTGAEKTGKPFKS
ncbi:GNAT family N-acetyltransferase [Roseicyclus persicicus]|uniref:GNAT family N-acetyltransferase n=1 Tax=Roseicyclus persicicus TaxID=2650661 RepID=A0A7X6GXH8_9RHOB|nr:GNAT family N-acetyltransferase [Roseibacterium persicicum]NKX43343.1 GNAT family N-acetyltransferase [Roseibacterium persicicum]